jgi:sortase, srtB family
MQSKNMKRLISTALSILLLCVFLFSAYKIYSYFREERESSYLTNSLIDEAVSEQTASLPSDSENKPNAKERPPITVDFNALWETNQDIIAWIYCEDTPINYPIVQSDDNSYYLRRLLDGSYNVAGTLFLDYRCKADFTDCNSIIYGHNMKNDTMFGTLPEYTEQSYYEAHPVMWLLTPEQNYKVELFAGFVTPSDSESYDIVYDRKDREQYIEEALLKSTFTADVETERIERIITLSTCSYEYENARFILIGIKSVG